MARAWGAGARPERLVIDLDSSFHEVHGYKKRGARYGHTRLLGYHPILTSRTDDLESVEAEHRDHAQIDMDQIRDLKAAADRSVVDRAARLPV